jgi:hypothetical protein
VRIELEAAAPRNVEKLLIFLVEVGDASLIRSWTDDVISMSQITFVVAQACCWGLRIDQTDPPVARFTDRGECGLYSTGVITRIEPPREKGKGERCAYDPCCWESLYSCALFRLLRPVRRSI